MKFSQHQKNSKNANICLIGAFPPPIVGISIITEQVKKSLQNLGVSTFIINLSPRSLTRNWQNVLIRPLRVIIGIGKYLRYLCITSNPTIYLAVSGGLGQVYDIFFVMLARLFKKRMFLHHHSYAYVDKKRLLTSLLLQISGGETVHIVLCGDMQYKFRNLYKSVKNTEVISNAGVLDWHETQNVTPKKELKTIGFFSNIFFEKGIAEFFDIAEYFEKKGRNLTALIAGPFQNNDVEAFVHQRISMLKNVSYVGSKYGDKKAEFYKAIDVLLFPTKYVNEAEPITILESMSYGVPVIAWGLGCIINMIPSGAGLVVFKDKDFVLEAINQIEFWHEKTSNYQKSSRLSRELFFSMKTLHSKNFDKFLRRILINN
jgi:glycosyltransferase involved in cell wall biosynthesis